MLENSEITGVGQLSFSMDTDPGNTPYITTGIKEGSMQQQSCHNQSSLATSISNVSNIVPAVTVTPSTPLLYTPSPATNILQTGSPAQRCGGMPPPVLRPKPKRTFSHVASSNTSGIALNLLSALKRTNKNNGNSSFGFLPKGQLKWSANLLYNSNENSPLPPLSLELSPALETKVSKSPYQTEITMTPVNLQASCDGTNVDSSPYAILTPLGKSKSPETTYTTNSGGKDGMSVVINTSTANADQKATNKRVRHHTRSLGRTVWVVL